MPSVDGASIGAVVMGARMFLEEAAK